jgi:hypothetical protein
MRGRAGTRVQGDGADGAFDGVAVDFDATIGQEAAEALAVSGDVGQGLAAVSPVMV